MKSGRRSADKRLVNRSSTAVVFPIGLHRILFVRASGETFKTIFFALEGKREGCFLGEPTRRRSVLPRPAPPRPATPPCAASPRPARCMSGFWTGQVIPCLPEWVKHAPEPSGELPLRRCVSPLRNKHVESYCSLAL